MHEHAVQLIFGAMLAIITYFLKRIISEHTQTREAVLALGSDLRIAQRDAAQMMAQITALNANDQRIFERLTDIAERLVRAEERTLQHTK